MGEKCTISKRKRRKWNRGALYRNTFLVHLAIVLSLRKAPIGLVYKPIYVFLCPLASFTHQLPSNLVSPLELLLVSSLYDYPMTVQLTLKRVVALPRQLLD